MKKVLSVIWLLTITAANAGSAMDELTHAQMNGAKARIILRCVDQDGLAVPNAKVRAGFFPDGSFENSISFNGQTGINGEFEMQGKTNGEYSYEISKRGYYKTFDRKFLFKEQDTFVEGGRWQPYGATNIVVLKRKINPVAMCVASSPGFLNITIPVHDVSVGFDLEKCDWVPPYGGGSYSDIQLKYELRQGAEYLDVKSMLTMSFTNKFGGAYVMEKDLFSSLPSVYGANTNARFVAEYQFVYDRKPDKVFENSFLPINKYLVFRCRTKVDKNGNLVISHYGKIYGNIDVNRKGRIRITYYFNPSENDPNLEADTTRNLLNPRDLGFSP